MLFTLVLASSASSATANDSYQAGISSFKSAHYEQALEHFVAARKAGLNIPTLHYNLGATHYKLGQYRLAGVAFSAIDNDATWGALAQYNLGLIANKMDQPDQAQRRFRNAKQQATTDKLKQLADAKLTSPDSNASAPKWTNHFSLGSGYDDNVFLADDQTLANASDESDSFLEVAAFANRYLSGNFADGWRLDLGGYYRGHNDLNDYDFGAGSVAAMYNRLLGPWHVQAGLRGDVQLAGSDHYTSGATFRTRAYRRFGSVGLRLTNDFGVIEGASSYDYLSGTRNRLTAEFIRRVNKARWRLGYLFEINDRDDLVLTNEFFSYSPTRHGVFGAVEIPLSERWAAEVRADFRTSDYDDQNVEIELDDSVTQMARDADRISTTLRLAYRVHRNWQLFVEYQYNDSDSDFDRYSYNSSRYQIGIESAR